MSNMEESPKWSSDLGSNERVEILGWLREARAQVLYDAEAFASAVAVLERVGQVLAPTIKIGLGAYKEDLRSLSMQCRFYAAQDFDRLLQVVRQARNSAVHEGAFARHLTGQLVDILLILEDAITSNMVTTGDLMVPTPFIAEPWHLVGHVRNAMLKNSFSYLPIHVDDDVGNGWYLISDESIVSFLKRWKDLSSPYDTRRAAKTMKQAIAEGLKTIQAPCLSKDAPIPEALGPLPCLVLDEGHLVGILTNFDLL